MNPYDFFAHFTNDLQQWFAARFLPAILNFEGGWEYWMQIDFPAWLDGRDGVQYDFRREISAYGSRVDWLINSNSTNQVLVAVELKNQTAKTPNGTFVANIKGDIESLAKWPDTYVKLSIVAAVDRAVVSDLYGMDYQLIASPNNVFFLRKQVA